MIVLYVLLGIIAAIVLLFCIKITVELRYEEIFEVTLKVLFIKLRLVPAKPKKPKKEKPKKEDEKPKEEKPKPEKPKEKKPKGDNFIMRFYHEQGFNGVLQFLNDILHALNTMLGDIFRRSFIVQKLFLEMRVSKADAAETALTYGKVCAAVYPTLGYLCDTLRVRKFDADIQADYLANKSTASFLFELSVRPIKLTNALVRFAFRAVVSYIKAKKRAKKKSLSVDTERKVDQ